MAVSDDINRKISEARRQPWDESRCRICGWPVKASLLDGCTVNSCSQRPAPARRADDNSRDWTGSEDASAVLLEEMPSPELCRTRFASGHDGWMCRPDIGISTATIEGESERSKERKTVIALAWLKWKGIA